MREPKRRRQALERLSEVAAEAGRVPEDPGLRSRFGSLPRAPVRLICCPLDKGINHGNILRVAECFRIEEVCFAPVGERKERDFSGGFAALKWQPYRWVDAPGAIRQANEAGCRVYGLALSEGATPVREVAWEFPAAIVLGRELEGIDGDAADLCDEFVAIPLFGVVQSLNVAVSAAIAVECCVNAFRLREPRFAPARALSAGLLKNPTPPAEG